MGGNVWIMMQGKQTKKCSVSCSWKILTTKFNTIVSWALLNGRGAQFYEMGTISRDGKEGFRKLVQGSRISIVVQLVEGGCLMNTDGLPGVHGNCEDNGDTLGEKDDFLNQLNFLIKTFWPTRITGESLVHAGSRRWQARSLWKPTESWGDFGE